MAQKRIFISAGFSSDFSGIFDVIQAAADSSERATKHKYIMAISDNLGSESIHENKLSDISNADLFIIDTAPNSNALYDLGFADALGKPTIIINNHENKDLPNFYHRPIISYDVKGSNSEFRFNLENAITRGILHPDALTWKMSNKYTKTSSVFVSYSHVDKEYLNRFLVHTKPLEKKGLVDIWVDTKIKAGDKWEEEIEKALSHAAIAILMISADFLASDFIVDNELPPLLESAQTKGTRILPVILKPCRFSREPHLSKFQALNKPENPLLLMPEIEQEVLWDKLTHEIEIEIDNKG